MQIDFIWKVNDGREMTLSGREERKGLGRAPHPPGWINGICTATALGAPDINLTVLQHHYMNGVRTEFTA